MDAEATRSRVAGLQMSDRVGRLKDATLAEERVMSVDQARIITESYRLHREAPRVLQRAHALAAALRRMPIRVDAEELIVGNRTPGVRSGVVSPEAGISWVADELDSLPDRPQDPFGVRPQDADYFRNELLPFWKGKTLEDIIAHRHGERIRAVKKVVKINQTDHAQGHISPNVRSWLKLGPAGLLAEVEAARSRLGEEDHDRRDFLDAVAITLEGSRDFMRRFAEQAESVGAEPEVAEICRALAERPATTFREAVQGLWFLFVVLQMESNASSFSPGRMDQYLLPYLEGDLAAGRIDLDSALEIIEALWVKFNQIVYMRSAPSAQYFAGFPIGFNIALGGTDEDGQDSSNILSYLFLKAQEHLGLPQPNLSARLHRASPESFVDECAKVIGLGSGMPQIVNDESIVPALERVGISTKDARDYAVVGCVELSTPGNNLGWSDAAMFNLVKALELALTDGVCLLTGERIGPATGSLADHGSYDAVLAAFKTQIDHFIEEMIPCAMWWTDSTRRCCPHHFYRP
jgi:pyruvate-formate lyase